jgi:hypothetical protein
MKLRWLLAVLLLSGMAVPAWGQRPIIGDPNGDGRLTMQSRKRLADDPDLAAINIGVIVTERVAVLWGPVPSAEAGFRAELCLKGMVELAEVRNETFVSELVEPIRRPLKIDVPPLLPERLPPAPPKLPGEARPMLLGAPGVLMGQTGVEPKKAVLTAQKPVLPAIALLPPAPEPDADAALSAAIQSFLHRKTTYRGLQFTVKERRVFLRTSDQDFDALHEAAGAIARLPNVEGVVLDKAMPR